MALNYRYIILIFIFFILQAVWFNQILLFGKYTPILFIYPLLILPLQKNETTSLFLAFFLGLSLDVISNTGGIFAATAVFITYSRKLYFLLQKNASQDFDQIQILNLNITSRIVYYFIFILIAQILIYFLESFNLNLLISKLDIILVNSIISLIFYIFIDILFINRSHR